MAEDASSVSLTVELLGGCPGRDVIVTLRTVNGSARGRTPKNKGIKYGLSSS